ncbi:general transcriptional corepressor trfA-like [Pectinophora gossypiella]|uniref:general transcriptional corepressor trfA-like n=1 Tax=Pectinophora gossypiella TaxID=13191 RepID=UPI00214ED3CA|nr:general transcriptional corepressor trfA-like [Pectinophora gossypiella]
MKFSTGSSSSSLASDSLSRKSTLCIYTEVVDAPPPCERMDSSSEAMELRRELDAVRSALQQQSESVLKQRHQLVEAGQALAARDKRAAQERRLRQDQLALVLRSLVLLESRLTREQKQIHVALQQKEKIIKSQQEEIAKLKARKSYCSNCQQLLGFTSEQTNIETDPEFQSLESTDSRFQNSFVRSCSYRERNSPPVFQKNTRLSKSFQLPKNDVVYGNTSSSEEGNTTSVGSKGTFIKNKQAFVRRDVFRRSRKYSGRKNNNKFSDNQKGYNNQLNNSSSAEECVGMSYQVNNDLTANQIAKDIRRASLKIDQLIGEAAKKEPEIPSSDSDKTYSTKMERLHGIKRQGSDEIKANRQLFLNNVLREEGSEKPWYCNVSDPEQDADCLDQRTALNNAKSKSTDDLLGPVFNNGILNAEIVSAKNEVLCNNILKNNNDRFNTRFDDKNNNIEANVNKPPVAAEINENWYASTSDADDSPSNEIYKNNPVLECVNQILLQNSLDDSSNDNSKSSEAPSPKTTTKRVQFSTLNSISYDEKVRNNNNSNNTLPRADKRSNKIVKFSLETASEHSYEVPNTAQGYQYEIQSIYSNEYEPIITKTAESKPIPLPRTVPAIPINNQDNAPKIRGSIVKNIAANIENRSNNAPERKSENDLGAMKIFNKRKVPRTPPALPPKPKNLSAKWKAENSVKPAIEPIDSEAVAANQRVADVKMRKVGQVATINNVEPDYCSISEINVPVVSHGKRELLLTQPTVEIHNEQYPIHAVSQRNSVAKVVSLPRIQNKISDKDIPKLPQVTEIIIPDEDEKPNEENRSFQQTTESYLTNFNMHPLQPKLDPRASIQMGNTVSSILSEINKGGKSGAKQINLTELDNQFSHGSEKVQASNAELHKAEYFDDIDKFDLSQNFEEFKIDDELGSIVAEEYRISSGSSDGSMSDVVTEHLLTIVPEKDQPNNNGENVKNESFLDNENLTKSLSKNAKLSNKPDLLSNIENLETESVRNSDIESSNSSGSNSGSYNTVKCEPRMILNNAESNAKTKGSFDFFLESSGLSSKSIFTPSKSYLGLRPPSANHKNVLKPRDIKMRVKNNLATNKINDKPMTTAIKYFEPYV